MESENMNTPTPCDVPLLELLDSIDLHRREIVEIGAHEYRNIPYGIYCHEAAERIRQLERELAETKQSLETELMEGGYWRQERDCLRDEVKKWREDAERLAEELKWCSGSSDFNEGGVASLGWMKGPFQALAAHQRLVEEETK